MLTEVYIEALLVDEDLADGMWELWESGEISSITALFAWLLIVQCQYGHRTRKKTRGFARLPGMWRHE